MNTIDFPFADLPLIRSDEAVAFRVDGTATISYDRNGNWRVEQISFSGDNGQTGAAFQSVDVDLSFGDNAALWLLIDLALNRECADAIVDHIVADEPHIDEYAEHRLGARDLGVGAYARAW